MLISVHPLFEIDRSQVDRKMLDSFLSLGIEENFTVDYKGAADGSPLTTIAAMANTYGGLVLVGVDWNKRDKERPGQLKPVRNAQREIFVSQMVGAFSPRWTPEVIPVVIDDDHSVLVVRIFPDLVPRPLMYRGTVPIRREGRNDSANLAEIQSLLAEGRGLASLHAASPVHNPSGAYASIRLDKHDPAIVVRAFTSAHVLRGVPRPHIDLATHEAIIAALTQSRLPLHVAGLASRIRPGGQVSPQWVTVENFTTSLRARMWFGSMYGDGNTGHVTPGVRAFVVVTINGDQIDIALDLAIWIGAKAQPTWDDLVNSAYRLVNGITGVHDAVVEDIVGRGVFGLPAIELHIEPGLDPFDPQYLANQAVRGACGVANVADLSSLGPLTRERERLGRVSEFLPADLVQAGDTNQAVGEALRLMALDWGFHVR
jgi:hypothetical protein